MATFTAAIDGVNYSMGKHGVVTYDGGADFLPGWRTVEFARLELSDTVRSMAIDAGVKFCNPCNCPARF